jgi:hypothetical protein
MKFGSAQPAALEPIPKQNRVHLPGEFIDAPQAFVADLLARRVERNAVQLAERVDFCPMRADEAVFKSNMVRPASE